jgi:Protein of unknown function (DUF3768)
MLPLEQKTTNAIALLNDQLRKAPPNQDWIITPGAKDEAVYLLDAIAKFDDWGESNDPWKEHDFGSIDCKGRDTSGKLTTSISIAHLAAQTKRIHQLPAG